MNKLIKLTAEDDGEPIDLDDQKWCLTNPYGDCERVLCCGQALDGDSYAEFEVKTVNRGGIECESCISIIKGFKQIRL